ncbi:MAG: stage II sporulation protein D [Bacillota bacterium]|nr:stage II sporulation protein D [Bacillota bacterium]
MKRILMLGIVLLGAVYLLPFITTGKNTEAVDPAAAYDTAPESVADGLIPANSGFEGKYDKAKKVTVLISGQVKEMTLGEYLPGVLAAEIPASFPDEALKAQAVAARTYAMYKIRLSELGKAPPESHKGAILCDNPKHCKAYINLDEKAAELWGSKAEEYSKKIKNAVKATDGVTVTYQNEPIAAVFHAASSKKTENAADVWGTDTPYLKSVDSPGGDASPKYSAEVTIPITEFKEKFLKKYPNAKLDASVSDWFKASRRSEAGGIIDVEVGGVRVAGTAIRELFGLNSTNFTVSHKEDSITFHTTGYGHGVGLSQYGARALALQGKNYEEILKWYYKGVTIKKPV